MSKFLQLAAVFAMTAGISASAQAQSVAMYGEYGEANGTVVKIPQNPPNVLCLDQSVPANARDARCAHILEHAATVTTKDVWEKPIRGTGGARAIPTHPGDVDHDGLDVGDPFIVPPLVAFQRLGRQGGIVLNDNVQWLDTTFTVRAPRTGRETWNVHNPTSMNPATRTGFGAKKPAALTRNFSAMNWTKAGNGQNNGIQTGMGAFQIVRPAPIAGKNVVTAMAGGDSLQMTYTLGPRQFGGTMANLLDGTGHLFYKNPSLSGLFPANAPLVGTLPLGDDIVGNLRDLNGNGWDFTGIGGQQPGVIRGFANHPGLLPPECNNSGQPPGCNVMVLSKIQQGTPLFPAGSAVSVKHHFPLTTGQVSIVRTGPRPPAGTLHTQTNTGRGYDTVMTGPNGPERNVGLVAGSYTTRTDFQGTQINVQVLGWKLKFTPEPGATAALASGIGLLGLLGHAARLRRS